MKNLIIIPTAGSKQELNYISTWEGIGEILILERNKNPLLKVLLMAGQGWEDHDNIFCIHDDLRNCDSDFLEKAEDAFKTYDYWGVAGTNMMMTSNPRWHVPVGNATALAGHMEHQAHDGRRYMTSFGPYPAKAVVVDGVFMAFKREVFDSLEDVPALDGFHMYDMEMCTQAHLKGFNGGVVGVHLFHESRGEGILTGEWERLAKVYSDRHRDVPLIWAK